MNNDIFKIGDRVIVTATLTGLVEDLPGTVTDTEMWQGMQLVTITYDRTLPDGRNGIVAYSYQQIYLLT